MYDNFKLMKMKNLSKVVLAFMLIIGMSVNVFAQEKEMANKTKFSIEIDPSTFVFKGYGVHLRIQPKNSEHLLFGAGTYAMDFPDLLVNLNKNNKDQGWGVRLKQGYGLFGEYHFGQVNKGWFAGSQLAMQEYLVTKENYVGDAAHTNMMLMATGGYTLQPFNFGLYFKFWGGVGYTKQVAGKTNLGDAEFDVSPMINFGALHIGYTF